MSSRIRTPSLRSVYLLAGPVLGLVALLLMPAGIGRPAVITAGTAVWMAVWWVTEAVPLAVTSLLPLAILPLSGVMKSSAVAGLYMNDVIFLFVGGFMVALAMEKWNLHRRIALRVILLVGGGPRRTLFGFMLATGFVSMWTSNTATAMMMVPIASAVLAHYDQILEERNAHRVSLALLLGVAYAASIGGMATLVGTPPNLVFARIFSIQFPNAPEITFAEWMFFAVPLSFALLIAAWALLSVLYVRRTRVPADTHSLFRSAYRELGPIRPEERSVLITFLILVVLWVTRETLNFGVFQIPGWSGLLPEPAHIGDGTVAITMGILLFILPAKQPGERILNWETARQLPWGIVLLFGGGFALAGAIASSGLDSWIGAQMRGFAALPPVVTTVAICLLLMFLTELTSNTATTQMALPILAATAVGISRNPFFLMVPATIAASCSFMMPVATPPNAIIFGTGRVRIIEMARSGILLNIIAIVLITVWLHLAGPSMFGGSPGVLPAWATTSAPIQP